MATCIEVCIDDSGNISVGRSSEMPEEGGDSQPVPSIKEAISLVLRYASEAISGLEEAGVQEGMTGKKPMSSSPMATGGL